MGVLNVYAPHIISIHSHVLRHGGVGDSRGRRVQAVLAAHAAAVAAEAVHVGVVGVLRACPSHPWVKWVLLVYVVVIWFPRSKDKHQQMVSLFI